MNSQNLLSVLAILLVLLSSASGAVGTVAASPSDTAQTDLAQIQFQQDTPDNNTTETLTETENDSTNNTTSTPTSDSSFSDGPNSSESDSGDDTVVVVNNGNSNNQNASNDSNATAQSEDAPFNTSKAEHEFNNGIYLNEIKNNRTHAVFQLYNPTNETEWVVTNNNAGQTPRIKSYELEPNESKTLTTPTTGNILQWSVSVTSTESIQSIETGAQYNIEHSALVINWNPAGELGPVIGVIGGLLVIILFVAVMKLNLRVGRIAIPRTGQPAQGVYSDDDLPDRNDPYSKQAKDWIHGWGLVGVVLFGWVIGSLAFWDLYPIAYFFELTSGFGRLYDPSTVVTLSEVFSNLMVYWAYNCLIFFLPVWQVGKYYLKENGVYLHDIDPKTGDNHAYLLSPTRFADLEVYKKGRDPKSGKKLPPKQVEKDRLAENNQNTDKRSYECEKYDPRKNVAYLSWEGEKKKVKPSQLRRHERLVDYLLETSSTLWDRYGNLRDKFTILAQQESRRLNAKQTAQIEGGILEDGENTRDRLDRELADAGFDDVVEGEERTIEEVVESETDETAPHLDSSNAEGDSR